MPNYRREWTAGGTYFFTLVTYQRNQWLCQPTARQALREAIQETRRKWPFDIEAWVLLPDHMHCIWTLPDENADCAIRWRRIKQSVSQRVAGRFGSSELSDSRIKRGETGLWQRRFWEHRIRDEADFRQHCDYIHYNPVKHGYCLAPSQWPYSSFGRLVRLGVYPPDRAMNSAPVVDAGIGRNSGVYSVRYAFAIAPYGGLSG